MKRLSTASTWQFHHSKSECFVRRKNYWETLFRQFPCRLFIVLATKRWEEKRVVRCCENVACVCSVPIVNKICEALGEHVINGDDSNQTWMQTSLERLKHRGKSTRTSIEVLMWRAKQTNNPSFCSFVRTTETRQDRFTGALTLLFVAIVGETYPAAIICGLETIFLSGTMETVSFTSFILFGLRLSPNQECVYLRLALRLFNMPIKLKFTSLPFRPTIVFVLMRRKGRLNWIEIISCVRVMLFWVFDETNQSEICLLILPLTAVGNSITHWCELISLERSLWERFFVDWKILWILWEISET